MLININSQGEFTLRLTSEFMEYNNRAAIHLGFPAGQYGSGSRAEKENDL